MLAVGDAVQPGRLPTLDWFCGGWIGGLQNAQKSLLDRADAQTKIVPALGPVMTKADLQASYETVAGFLNALAGAIPARGDKLQWRDWRFTISETDGRRATRIRALRERRAPG